MLLGKPFMGGFMDDDKIKDMPQSLRLEGRPA